MKYAHRQWWYSPRILYRWVLFRGCANFSVHPTWRFGAHTREG